MAEEDPKAAAKPESFWQRANETRPKTDPVRAFGEAVRDMRQKLVEEMWFGKPVTDAPAQGDIWSTAKAAREGRLAPAAAAEPEKAEPEAARSDPEPEL